MSVGVNYAPAIGVGLNPAYVDAMLAILNTTPAPTSTSQIVINVKDPAYGAVGDGVTNDSAAIALAMAAVNVIGRAARLYFPSGTYKCDGVNLTVDGTGVEFSPGAVLLARTTNVSLLKISASRCVVFGGGQLNGNFLAGTDGLALVPANESDHATQVNQNYNFVSSLRVVACDNQVRMRCGPGTLTGDSGCWYNTLVGVRMEGTGLRGLWLQSPVTNAGGGASAGSPVNRNTFVKVTAGNLLNVGLQIDAGSTNDFHGFAAEGIISGATPLATPTGLYIAATDAVSGASNLYNRFFSYSAEANTRDIFNDSPSTEFFAVSADPAKLAGAFPKGAIFLSAQGTLEPNLLPTLRAQYVQTEGATTGVIANGANFTITLTTTKFPMLLMISQNVDLRKARLLLVAGDDAVNVTVNTILDTSAGLIAVAATGAKTIQVTNNMGAGGNYSWGVLMLGKIV
jgi:hypothetical protein